MKKYIGFLCWVVATTTCMLAPGCGCFEDEVEDATEEVIKTIFDEFFIDGIAYLELDPIIVDYPADGGQPACVTTSIVNELSKLGADTGPEDFEQIWLWVVFQSYREALWTPAEAIDFNCTTYLADESGEVELDWPWIESPEEDWWYNAATIDEAKDFIHPYLAEWDQEFQACVRCEGNADTRYLEYLFKLQVATEKKD